MMYQVSYPSGLTLQVWGRFSTIEHKGRSRPSITADNSDVVYLIPAHAVVRSSTAILYEPPTVAPEPVKKTKKPEMF
jgi:hypothetical protein